MTASETLVVLGALVFLASQLLNRVALRWRALGSLLGIGVSLVALLVDLTAWEAAIFGWFLGLAALIGKWAREVAFDKDARKERSDRLSPATSSVSTSTSTRYSSRSIDIACSETLGP